MTDLLHFEDFHAGQIYDLGRHRLTPDEIIAFAHEFDPQPQHLDAEAAKRSILGGLAASGWHLCSLAMRMLVDGLLSHAESLGAPAVDDVQWRRPVLANDLLRMDAEVLDTRESSSGRRGYVRMRFSMYRLKDGAADERVMQFSAPLMIGRKAEGPRPSTSSG